MSIANVSSISCALSACAFSSRLGSSAPQFVIVRSAAIQSSILRLRHGIGVRIEPARIAERFRAPHHQLLVVVEPGQHLGRVGHLPASSRHRAPASRRAPPPPPAWRPPDKASPPSAARFQCRSPSAGTSPACSRLPSYFGSMSSRHFCCASSSDDAVQKRRASPASSPRQSASSWFRSRQPANAATTCEVLTGIDNAQPADLAHHRIGAQQHHRVVADPIIRLRQRRTGEQHGEDCDPRPHAHIPSRSRSSPSCSAMNTSAS